MGNMKNLVFSWEMSIDDFLRLKKDHAARQIPVGGDNIYGVVHMGHLCIEILHTWDVSDWYAFSNVYGLGIDTGYGYTPELHKPYTMLDGSPMVPIEFTKFEEFKLSLELSIKGYLLDNPLANKLAEMPLGNWK